MYKYLKIKYLNAYFKKFLGDFTVEIRLHKFYWIY